MAKRDYYEVLQVARDASPEDIKKAYRKLAIAHHPDKNPGDKKAEDRFREATEAYQVLADSEKRQSYDRFGHDAFANLPAGEAGAGASGFGGAGFGDIFEDIFEDFFGSRPRKANRPQRGGDLRVDVEVSFEESAEGVERTLAVRREESCVTCRGEGAQPGTTRSVCTACHGTGQTLQSSGFFSIARLCSRCEGRGSWTQHPCRDCRGSGRVEAERKIQVNIPAGVETGMRLRMTGEGEAGARGGARGDLYLDIHVRPHEFFTREGDDVICEVPVPFVQAALGDELRVHTLSGPVTLKIPAGTQSGKTFRLKGHGFGSLSGRSHGDQVVRVTVETPTHLNEKQKELLRQLAAASGDKESPISSSFGEKMKKLFRK